MSPQFRPEWRDRLAAEFERLSDEALAPCAASIQPGDIVGLKPFEKGDDRGLPRLAAVLRRDSIEGHDLLLVATIHHERSKMGEGDLWLFSDESGLEHGIVVEVWNSTSIPADAVERRYGTMPHASLAKARALFAWLADPVGAELPAGTMTGPPILPNTVQSQFRAARRGSLLDLAADGFERIEKTLKKPDQLSSVPRSDEAVETISLECRIVSSIQISWSGTSLAGSRRNRLRLRVTAVNGDKSQSGTIIIGDSHSAWRSHQDRESVVFFDALIARYGEIGMFQLEGVLDSKSNARIGTHTPPSASPRPASSPSRAMARRAVSAPDAGRIWIYRATTDKADRITTYDLARRSGYLWRSYYRASTPPSANPNVDKIRMGDRLVLAYREQGRLTLMGLFRVGFPSDRAMERVIKGNAIVEIPGELHEIFARSGYRPDPVLGTYVGLELLHICDLEGEIPDWQGQTTIRDLEHVAAREIVMPYVERIRPWQSDDVLFAEPEPSAASPRPGEVGEDWIRRKADEARRIVESILRQNAASGVRLPIVLSIDPWSDLAEALRTDDSPVWRSLKYTWKGTRQQLYSDVQMLRRTEFRRTDVQDPVLTAAVRRFATLAHKL